ncbi:MAG TPA: hypothetical protein HA261_07145 [Methanosarcina sp.]|nr:hypothetical protein [Methanosarcina sp.]
MKLDTIIRSFLIAGLISLIAVILESAYYGLRNASYSVVSPFVSTAIGSPTNMAIIAIIFISTFVIVLNCLSKKEKA